MIIFQVPTYHLIIESFLFLWVLWLLVRRVSARRKNKAEIKLTREEEEELLAEWKPEPLISGVDPDHEALHVPVIDHKVAINRDNTVVIWNPDMMTLDQILNCELV